MTTEIAETFGVEDQWPVAAEPFTAWFLEDEFTSGRPPLENVASISCRMFARTN